MQAKATGNNVSNSGFPSTVWVNEGVSKRAGRSLRVGEESKRVN